MNESEDLSKGDLIIADLYSRPNALNGKYVLGQLELDNLADTKSADLFYIESLKMKADLADKMIAEAESQGHDTTDLSIMKALGESIHAAYTPVHRSESILTAISVSLRIITYYGIAIGIWGPVFETTFLSFGLYGVVVGLAISSLSIAPVIAVQRTRQRIRTIVFGASMMWGNLGIIIGAVGLLAWAARSLL